jgi:hypothetical protein
MHFNVDRIAQLAGLGSGAATTTLNEGRGGRGVLAESAGRPARPTSTYDRVVEELQLRGLELFYTPEQINEAIKVESKLLREEREMDMEGMHGHNKEGMHGHMGHGAFEGDEMASMYEDEGMYEDEASGMYEEADTEMYHAMDEMMNDIEEEAMAVGTTITQPDGTVMRVTKAGSGTLEEAKLVNFISREVDSVLRELAQNGDTAWMYPSGKRPTGARGVTMGFAGSGFKR